MGCRKEGNAGGGCCNGGLKAQPDWAGIGRRVQQDDKLEAIAPWYGIDWMKLWSFNHELRHPDYFVFSNQVRSNLLSPCYLDAAHTSSAAQSTCCNQELCHRLLMLAPLKLITAKYTTASDHCTSVDPCPLTTIVDHCSQVLRVGHLYKVAARDSAEALVSRLGMSVSQLVDLNSDLLLAPTLFEGQVRNPQRERRRRRRMLVHAKSIYG